VASLSALLLQRGFELCVLYTDLSNPTSNSIYSGIGYRPVRDFLMFDLVARVSSF
jgi:predicted GNAT family acetyltransferase